MKKSLVALAVLAATGAFAQSSVTLYGIVEATTDIGYNRTQNSTTTTTNRDAAGVVIPATSSTATTSSSQKNNFRIQDGNDQGTGTSRVGFRGTEDLGGGLKANFLMEMGLRIDDGCTTLGTTAACANGGGSGDSGGAMFGRNAWGGLSGGFGEVRLGRQVLGSFGVQANSWAAGASQGLYDAGMSTAPLMGGVRFSNAIRYMSPNFGGFKASVMLSAPETGGATSTTSSGSIATPAPASSTSASRRTGVDLALEYANGPAYIGFGYNKRDAANVTSSTTGLITTGDVTGYTVGGSYDLGVVKPFINYTRQTTGVSGSTPAIIGSSPVNAATNASDANARALSIGLRAPVGAFTVIAGYGRSTTTINGMGTTTATSTGVIATSASRSEEKRDAFQLGTQYALSKRTLIEANYGISKLRSNGDTSLSNGNFTAATGAIAPATGTSASRSFNSNDRISAFNVGLKHSF